MNLTRLSANLIWSSSILSFAFSALALMKILLLEILIRSVQNNPSAIEQFLPFFDPMFNSGKNGAAIIAPVVGILMSVFLYIASNKVSTSKRRLIWAVSVLLLGAAMFQFTPLLGLLVALGGVLAVCDSRDIKK